MTGNGTQGNPYVPEDWDELVTAAETSGAYVKFPANAQWDMNDQYPNGAPGIHLKCAEIDGNSAVVKNLRVTDTTLFTLDTTEHDVVIKGLILSTMYITHSTVFYAVSYHWTDNNSIQLVSVAMAGEMYDSVFWSCDNQGVDTDGVSISFYMSNSETGSNSHTLTNTAIELNGTTTADVGGFTLASSAIYGSLRSYGAQRDFYASGEVSIADIELQNFANAYCSSSGSTFLLNVSKVGEATVSGSGVIQATEAQMHDAAWLHAAGFPCT